MINLKERTKKASSLDAEISNILGVFKKEKKKRYAFWNDAVGEKIAEIASPTFKKHGILFVKVQDSTWRFVLAQQKDELIESINKNLKEDKKIKDIIFK
jgi:predicted nucleic acid-binding Zn ribbon protein